MSAPTHFTTEILPGLYCSGMPEPTWPIEQWHIGLVVSLSEHAPPQAAHRFAPGAPGGAKGNGSIIYMHWPIPAATAPNLNAAEFVAECIARAHNAGTDVLVHCQDGTDRTGFIVALAVRQLKSMSGSEALAHVRALRPIALRNPDYTAVLSTLPPPTTKGPT
jgi:protein-tyrosine phosphatase